MSKEGILAPPAGIELARIHREFQGVISGKSKIPHTIPQGRNWGIGTTPDTSKIASLYLEIVNQCLRTFIRTTDQMAGLAPVVDGRERLLLVSRKRVIRPFQPISIIEPC
jgi:hypothetical protein